MGFCMNFANGGEVYVSSFLYLPIAIIFTFWIFKMVTYFSKYLLIFLNKTKFVDSSYTIKISAFTHIMCANEI